MFNPYSWKIPFVKQTPLKYVVCTRCGLLMLMLPPLQAANTDRCHLSCLRSAPPSAADRAFNRHFRYLHLSSMHQSQPRCPRPAIASSSHNRARICRAAAKRPKPRPEPTPPLTTPPPAKPPGPTQPRRWGLNASGTLTVRRRFGSSRHLASAPCAGILSTICLCRSAHRPAERGRRYRGRSGWRDRGSRRCRLRAACRSRDALTGSGGLSGRSHLRGVLDIMSRAGGIKPLRGEHRR